MARSDHATDVAQRLAALVALLDDAAEQDPSAHESVIIRLIDDDSDHELGMRPVDGLGDNVIDALVGFVAPAHWVALGVLVSGDAYAWSDPDPACRPGRAVHIVHRNGAAAWSLRRQGEPPVRGSTAGGVPRPEGATDDVCRRALGCSTAPPQVSTLALWAVLWLDAVVARAARDPGWSPTWSVVASLHPAAALAPVEAPALARLARLARVLARARPWEHLRRACANGSWPVPFIPPDHAAWMDDGMFSRWILDAYPSVAELAGMATDLLPDQTSRRIAEVIAGWELGP